MNGRTTDHHDDWLNLIEVSGPFLAGPVLREVFPQGLPGLDAFRAKRLRRAYTEWREALETEDPEFHMLHWAWIDEVLSRGLEMDDDGRGEVLRRGEAVPAALAVTLPEHGVTITPDVALVDVTRADAPLLLVHVFHPNVNLDGHRDFGGWTATPAERMVSLLRATACPVGLVTNGERWMLVHAPTGMVASFASWYARLWGQEPVTLQAFTALLGVRRFFGPDDERLPTLFTRSLAHQDEVTDALGEQVRHAIEVLVQAMDRADQDRGRELLRDVAPAELYEAGLTVMMRLVFLLAAEERSLLLLGDERYEAYYAVSSLRGQLRAESEEILERRRSAWSRLLALFRGVYGGIEHPDLRLPALGGSLFDPDRYPFLEGRSKGTSWRTHPAEPLPIDDRSVLLLLEAIQTFEGRTLSYRALDVEQIGHVYEGLLERTVRRTTEVTLELTGSSKARDARLTLGELESARMDGAPRLLALLKERTQRSETALRNDLARTVGERLSARLLTVCGGDVHLRDRILPFARLLRTDPWGYPLVHPAGAFIVVLGSDRRETGSHYTPKSLTEAIVTETLTPVAYVGPSEGKPSTEWVLKTPIELLDLKVCDPAMGSGAFLVQVCRWLGDRLVEAWAREEDAGRVIDAEGHVRETLEGAEPLPRDPEERTIIARRLVAERCLYGVDLNAQAVELAKLSLWLTTLAKDRPFGFLDHNLRHGDSVLGVHDLDQLVKLSLDPSGASQPKLYADGIYEPIREAIALRQQLRGIPIRQIEDVKAMEALDDQARQKLEVAERIADAFIGTILTHGGSTREVESRLAALALSADRAVRGDATAVQALNHQARSGLATDTREGLARHPFHWPLEFPEVFVRENGGFDAMVGNPPFLGGQRITGIMGMAYRDWLVRAVAQGRRGSADLVAYFFLRSYTLLRSGGGFGLLAVNTIAEGDTRQVGLEAMVQAGAIIHAAHPNESWPGAAAVVTSRVHVHKGSWNGQRNLLGRSVPHISAFLSEGEEWSPKRLKANAGKAFIGSYVLGMGFVLSNDEAQRMLDADPRNAEVIFPYLNGEDLNSDPEQRPSRWVINFWDWPEERAMTYQLPYERVRNLVKPERDKLNQGNADGRRRRAFWWRYGRDATGLYHAIGRGHHFERHPEGWESEQVPLDRLIVTSLVGKYSTFSFASPTYIYSHALGVIASDRTSLYSILNSTVHSIWSRFQGSYMKTDLRYTPSDVFETFPHPSAPTEQALAELDDVGHYLENIRTDTMRILQIGSTVLYNLVHSQDNRDEQIDRVRQIHKALDEACLKLYGWDDITLEYGFHSDIRFSKINKTRFSPSPRAQSEILHRLNELNRIEHQEQISFVPRTTSKHAYARKKESKLASPSRLKSHQAPLDFEISPSISTGEAAQKILEFLKVNPNWHGKGTILANVGVPERHWNDAINDLLDRGLVIREGNRRVTKYCAVPMKSSEEAS
ncbi:hypothetical protein HNR42_002847 [Deinobacterium chartae]|uniref:site-specific DNA-methyltransferase (adenine-specific) n=1 Tax=Deinobacterium chartae TaxID=521158 RepID=A0A841I2X2_9DEIO|nr:type IIL restriction-modification enzyme MmeI [Deinobacterium chartae]MBB6099406.1 hypothetical protein [Deinobacterium chartae]